MTKEELKNAISETIYSNGKKGISGDSLANLLIDIVDAAGEGGGNGGGDVFLKLELNLDEEGNYLPSEKNASLRQLLIDDLKNGITHPINAATSMPLYGDGEGNIIIYGASLLIQEYQYTSIGGTDELSLYMTIGTESTRIILNEDGSITIPLEETPESE